METVGLGFCFEDLPIGRQFKTIGRTVTEPDIVNFINTIGMTEVLFTNLDFLKNEAGFKGRLAPGSLVYCLAEGLLANAGSSAAVAELLASLPSVATPVSRNGSEPKTVAIPAPVAAVAPVAVAAPPASAPAAAPSSAVASTAVADDEPLLLEAYIDSVRCTTCNECTNLNNKMFAYNADKQAYVKDVKAGTFQQLVIAAERCPVSIIHPGTPLNAKEKDLAKWVKRAEKFN